MLTDKEAEFIRSTLKSACKVIGRTSVLAGAFSFFKEELGPHDYRLMLLEMCKEAGLLRSSKVEAIAQDLCSIRQDT